MCVIFCRDLFLYRRYITNKIHLTPPYKHRSDWTYAIYTSAERMEVYRKVLLLSFRPCFSGYVIFECGFWGGMREITNKINKIESSMRVCGFSGCLLLSVVIFDTFFLVIDTRKVLKYGLGSKRRIGKFIKTLQIWIFNVLLMEFWYKSYSILYIFIIFNKIEHLKLQIIILRIVCVLFMLIFVILFGFQISFILFLEDLFAISVVTANKRIGIKYRNNWLHKIWMKINLILKIIAQI